MTDRNVLGGELEPCGIDPLTGFYRDGCCRTGPEDRGSHTICAVVTSAFLEHQRRIGNDLITPMPQYHFPGLAPGDRWCVTAVNWLRAHEDGAAAYVVLASTHERALEVVSLAALQEHTVDVPRIRDLSGARSLSRINGAACSSSEVRACEAPLRTLASARTRELSSVSFGDPKPDANSSGTASLFERHRQTSICESSVEVRDGGIWLVG